MPRIKTKPLIITIVLFFLAFAAVLYWVSTRVKPESLQGALIPYLEEKLGGKLTFRDSQMSTFPRISAQLEGAEFVFDEGGRSSLRAGKVVFYLSFLHALVGKIHPARIEVYGGETFFATPAEYPLRRVELHDLELKISSLRAGSPVKFEVSSGLYGASGFVQGKGLVAVDELDPDLMISLLDAEFSFKQDDLAVLEPYLRKDFPVLFDQGVLEGNVVLRKEAQDPWLLFDFNALAGDVVYRMPEVSEKLTSPKFSSQLQFKWKINQETNEILLNRGSVVSPLGNISANGRFLTETGEIQNMRVTASKMTMEMIPHYLLPFNQAAPFNIGFSGLSDLEMSMEGTLDHLTIHANWDLAPALLTYGRFFSKPKELPLMVSSDFLLKKGNLLTGDFSLRLKTATLKGTLAELDLRTSSGKLNLITNKFDLQGWENLLPPLTEYDLGGDLKILISFDGDLVRLGETKKGFNLTLEKGWLTRKDDVGIQNAYLSMDSSDVAFKIKRLEFDFGDSGIEGDVIVYNFPKNPNAEFTFSSKQLKIDKAVHSFSALSEGWLSEAETERVGNMKDWIARYVPTSEPAENIQMKGTFKDQEWKISELTLDAFGGDMKAQVAVDMTSSLPLFWTDVEVNRLSLARYTSLAGSDKKIMDGNLFFKMRVSGHYDQTEGFMQDQFSGRGEVKVTNGEFHTFDLIEKISRVNELEDIGILSTDTAPFDDLQFSFESENGKWVTSNLVMLSPDLLVEGQGDLISSSGLNLRLEGYLSSSLTRQVLEPILGQRSEEEKRGERFGPIPFMMTGPILEPDVRLDSSQLAGLLEGLIDQKSYRVLRNFLPEDFLFEEADKS